MKGILEFNLPEETQEFTTATKANSLSCVISEFDNHLRGLMKYEDLEQVSIQVMRDKLRQIINEYEVSDCI